MRQLKSSWGAILGLAFAIVAIIGTQVFGWDWETSQLPPTIIGIIAAGIAVVMLVRRVVS
jgi:NhaP-type Na+/H+ or K+/H+ antiporter